MAETKLSDMVGKGDAAIPGLNTNLEGLDNKVRRMMVKGYEVGGHENYHPGDHLDLNVGGHVHSIQHDGTMVLHIESVKPQGIATPPPIKGGSREIIKTIRAKVAQRMKNP